VQEAQMQRLHGCKGAAKAAGRRLSWLLLVGRATRGNSPVKGEINN